MSRDKDREISRDRLSWSDMLAAKEAAGGSYGDCHPIIAKSANEYAGYAVWSPDREGLPAYYVTPPGAQPWLYLRRRFARLVEVLHVDEEGIWTRALTARSDEGAVQAAETAADWRALGEPSWSCSWCGVRAVRFEGRSIHIEGADRRTVRLDSAAAAAVKARVEECLPGWRAVRAPVPAREHLEGFVVTSMTVVLGAALLAGLLWLVGQLPWLGLLAEYSLWTSGILCGLGVFTLALIWGWAWRHPDSVECLRPPPEPSGYRG